MRSPCMVGAVMGIPPVVCKYHADSLQVTPQRLEELKRAWGVLEMYRRRNFVADNVSFLKKLQKKLESHEKNM